MGTEDETVSMMNAGIERMVPIAHQMGVRFVEVARGNVTAEVPAEGNTNHVGTVYAGVLFTVAEILGGAMAMASFDPARYYPIVKDLQIKFRRPAATAVRATTTLGEDAIAKAAADAERDGKADFVLDAELTDAAGTVVATSHGIYQLRAHGN
jgi:thioesterase domain-containing protein